MHAAGSTKARAPYLGVLGGLALVAAGFAVPTEGEARELGEPAPIRGLSDVASGWAAVDVAPTAGISAARRKTWSAAPADFDRDGDQDVLIGYHPVERLWRNEGDGSYVRVAADAWPDGAVDRHSCAWADVDRNGLPDVACTAGRGLRNRVKHARIDNELWLQTAAGEFVEVGTAWGIGDPCGRGRDLVFLHANGDRYPDLFVGNNVPRDVPDVCDTSPELPGEQSKLFVNVDGERFVHRPGLWPYGNGAGTRCAERIDVDRDGWDDLFACRDVGQTPRLYRNDRGRGFVDVTPAHALGTPISDAHVFRVGAERHPDLVTAGPQGFSVLRNDVGRLVRGRLLLRPEHGVGMAVAAGDADGDGDQDVYAMVGDGTEGNPDDWVLLRQAGELRRVRAPSAPGAADDVIALRRVDDRAEFLALNGFNLDGVGPVQLVRVVRRP